MTINSTPEIPISIKEDKKFEGLRKINSHDGWITPAGSFYACGPQDHEICARYLLATNKIYIENRLEKNGRIEIINDIQNYSSREVLKAAGYALLSDNLLAKVNMPENLSVRQLELIKRANLMLPNKENLLDFDTYKEIQKLAATEIDKYIAENKYFSDNSEPIRSLAMVVKDPTFRIHGEEAAESLVQTFDLLTKNYKAEQKLTMGKGTATWRLIETPSHKQAVVELLYHDHAQGDDDYGYPTEEWWISFKTKANVDNFIKTEMESGKHTNWSIEGNLESGNN